jgi:hypothetical protein
MHALREADEIRGVGAAETARPPRLRAWLTNFRRTTTSIEVIDDTGI